jgi:hypothetical protein
VHFPLLSFAGCLVFETPTHVDAFLKEHEVYYFTAPGLRVESRDAPTAAGKRSSARSRLRFRAVVALTSTA